MRRTLLVQLALGGLALVYAGCGSEEQPTVGNVDQSTTTSTALGDPLPGLSPGNQAAFDEGKDHFDEVEAVADGLGPVFNDVSCGACHNMPATGGSGTTTVTRFGRTTNGAFDPLANEGGSLIQVQGIGQQGACDYVGEVVPADANTMAHRRTTPLFGFGLINAIPDGNLIALAQVERLFPGNIAGRANVMTDIETGQQTVGRFGWKTQNPNLHIFAGDAYLNEMG